MTSDATTPAPDLISRDLGDEIVVMDETAQQVHLLKDEAADMWREGISKDEGISRRNLLRSATVLAGAGITTMALPPALAAASSGVQTTLTLSVASTMVRNSTGNSATGTDTRTVGGSAVAGQTVTLFADRLNGSGQVQSTTNLGSAVTAANGQYSITFTAPGSNANYNFYAVSTANATYNAAMSNVVPVNVTN